MRKLFSLLPMFGLILGAVAIASEIRTTDPVSSGQQMSGVVVSCIKTALEKRETAISSAYTTALTTRKTALLVAWDKTTKSEVKTAIANAWKSYKSTKNASIKTAWNTYKTDVKNCR